MTTKAKSNGNGHEHPPPNDPEAEQDVMGCIFMDPDLLVVAGRITGPEDMWTEPAKAGFVAAQRALKRANGSRIGKKEIIAELKATGAIESCPEEWVKAAIERIADKSNVDYYARQVRALADRRRVMDAAQQIDYLAREGQDYGKALDRLKLVTAPPPWLKQKESLMVTRMENVEMEDIRWLWPWRLVIGLNVLGGEPGTGKSTLLFDLTRRITMGENWPRIEGIDDDESVRGGPPGHVAFLCAESSKESEMSPRLKAAGADISRVMVIDGENMPDGSVRLLNLAEDVAKIKTEIHDKLPGGLTMLAIDPIGDFLPGIDSNSNDDVAPALQPLIDFAHECGVAVVMILHDNKVQTTNAKNKFAGATAYLRKSRAAWRLDDDYSIPGVNHKLMTPVKCNFMPRKFGMGFALMPCETGDPMLKKHPVVHWDAKPVDKTADEIVAARMQGREQGKRELRQAEMREMITEYLTKNGPSKGDDLFEYCAQKGSYKPPAIKKVLNDMKAQTKPMVSKGPWWWRLKDQEWPKDEPDLLNTIEKPKDLF